MSNHIISAVYGRVLGSIARKAVMVLFADKASDDGEGVYASKYRMAEELDMSRRALMNTIQSLEEDGIIRTVRTRENGQIEYAINMPMLLDLSLNVAGVRNAGRGRNVVPPQVNLPRNVVPGGVAGDATKPSFNHSLSESRPKPKKSSSFPESFTPELTDDAQAIVAQWPSGMLEREIGKFRDHHIAKGSRMKDWQAAFRTWIRNADEWKGKRDGRSVSTAPSFLDDWIQRNGS